MAQRAAKIYPERQELLRATTAATRSMEAKSDHAAIRGLNQSWLTATDEHVFSHRRFQEFNFIHSSFANGTGCRAAPTRRLVKKPEPGTYTSKAD